MRYSLRYLAPYSTNPDSVPEIIIDLSDVDTITTRGVVIESVHSIIKDIISIYLDQKPARIDQQGKIVYLLDQAFADRHPESILFHRNTKLFGIPKTIWSRHNAGSTQDKGSQKIKTEPNLSVEPAVHRGTEPEGIAIADELGIRYDGIQEGIGMQFTDTEVTGTPFYGNTLSEAKINLADKRQLFKEASRHGNQD